MTNIGYKQYLQNLKHKGCALSLKANIESINKESTIITPEKYYFKSEEAKFIYMAQNISKRKIKLNEVFFVISLHYPNGYEDVLPIPKTDLLELLKDKTLNFFEYKYFLNENEEPYMKYTLYHGTPKSKIKTIKQLTTSKGVLYGDFGRGIYLTPNSNYARSYLEINDFKRKGKLLHGICSNETINQIINDIYTQKNNLKPFEIKTIEGNNKKEYVLKMFSKDCIEWRESLWKGWVLGEKVSDCDIVIGPICSGKICRKAVNYRELYKNSITNAEKNKIKNEFIKSIQCIYLHENSKDIMALQLCIYDDEVLKNIIEGG